MNGNYLSRENTDCFKGICAMMVVLCHVCSRTGVGATIGLGPIYSALGYWGVSGFMFMSGYGLTCSLTKSHAKVNYLYTFVRNRIFPIYLLMLLLAVLYYILKIILSPQSPTFLDLIHSFFFGSTVISFGWYLQCIVLIYLLFYVAASLTIKFWSSSINTPLLISVGIGMLLYVGLCLALRLDATWYETVFSFVVGVFVSCYKMQVENWLSTKVRTIVTFLIFVGLFICCFVLGGGPYLEGIWKIIYKMLSSVLFCLSCLTMMRCLSLVNPVTSFLGSIYLEIYIIQGVIYLILRNKYWSLDSNIYFMIAITLVIAGAKLIKPLTTSFMRSVKVKSA